MATMNDIAKLANVSLATVSRVLNGSSAVKDETKALVMEWVRKLDYYPNYSAKTLAEKKSLIIALVIPDLFNPFFMEMIYHIERYVSQNGYSLLIANSDGNLERERAISNTLKARQVDGVLVGLVSQDSPLAEMLQKQTIPSVSITQNLSFLNSVSISHERGGVLAAQHLLEKDFKRFVYMGSDFDDPKFQGFRTHLLENQIPEEHIRLIDIGAMWFHTGQRSHQRITEQEQAVREWSEHKLGIFCINDIVALGVIQACNEMKLTVGDKVGVIGFDDTYLCQSVRPTLTSIAQNKDEMSRIGVELLLRTIDNRVEDGTQEQEHIILQPSLAKREST